MSVVKSAEAASKPAAAAPEDPLCKLQPDGAAAGGGEAEEEDCCDGSSSETPPPVAVSSLRPRTLLASGLVT